MTEPMAKDSAAAGPQAPPRPPFFVGDHPAMDFLNTVAPSLGAEWIGSGGDFVDWLEQAGAIGASVGDRFRRQTRNRRELDKTAAEARALREWLRAFVEKHAGKALGPEALTELEPLNRLLAQDDAYYQVEAGSDERGERTSGTRGFDLKLERKWDSPHALLQPIADAIADLVCRADFRLVRRCEGDHCTLMFYDRTKSHARRWCSMAGCGNRAKAAAHRARIRSKARRR